MGTFTVYQSRDGGWRWRLSATNGKTIADSGEAYASEYNAVRAAKRTKEVAPGARVQRLDGAVLDESKKASGSVDPF